MPISTASAKDYAGLAKRQIGETWQEIKQFGPALYSLLKGYQSAAEANPMFPMMEVWHRIMTRFNAANPAEKAKMIDAATSGAGMVAGTYAGAHAGSPVAGAAVGGMAGHGLGEVVNYLAGLPIAKTGPEVAEGYLRAGRQGAMAEAIPSAAATGAGMMKTGAWNAAKRIFEPSAETQRINSLRDKFGIPMTAGEATGSPALQRLESAAETYPTGSNPALASRMNSQKAFERAANEIGEKVHPGPVTLEKGGAALREGNAKAIDQLSELGNQIFEPLREKYKDTLVTLTPIAKAVRSEIKPEIIEDFFTPQTNRILHEAGALKPEPNPQYVQELNKTAEATWRNQTRGRGTPDGQPIPEGKTPYQALKDVDPRLAEMVEENLAERGIYNEPVIKKITFKQALQLRSEIGRKWASVNHNTPASEVNAIKQVSRGIDDSIKESIGEGAWAQDVQPAMDQYKEAVRQVKPSRNPSRPQMGNPAAKIIQQTPFNSDIPGRIVGPGGEDSINAALRSTHLPGEEEPANLTGAFRKSVYQDMLDRASGATREGFGLSPKKFGVSFSRLKEPTTRALFPDQASDIADLRDIGNTMGRSESLFANTSGTGGALHGGEVIEAAAKPTVGKMIKAVAAPWALSKTLNSPEFAAKLVAPREPVFTGITSTPKTAQVIQSAATAAAVDRASKERTPPASQEEYLKLMEGQPQPAKVPQSQEEYLRKIGASLTPDEYLRTVQQ